MYIVAYCVRKLCKHVSNFYVYVWCVCVCCVVLCYRCFSFSFSLLRALMCSNMKVWLNNTLNETLPDRDFADQ